jgi:hypothetical protein
MKKNKCTTTLYILIKNKKVKSYLKNNCNPLGLINQYILLINFLLDIYIQLEQKCLSELVEDIKKDTFRQAQCDNLV